MKEYHYFNRKEIDTKIILQESYDDGDRKTSIYIIPIDTFVKIENYGKWLVKSSLGKLDGSNKLIRNKKIIRLFLSSNETMKRELKYLFPKIRHTGYKIDKINFDYNIMTVIEVKRTKK